MFFLLNKLQSNQILKESGLPYIASNNYIWIRTSLFYEHRLHFVFVFQNLTLSFDVLADHWLIFTELLSGRCYARLHPRAVNCRKKKCGHSNQVNILSLFIIIVSLRVKGKNFSLIGLFVWLQLRPKKKIK